MIRVLTSLQHPLIKHFVKLRADNAYRYESQSLVIEGVKPIQEIEPHLIRILYTPNYAYFADPFTCEKWEVTDAIMKKISGMVSPEGIIAEVQIPVFESLDKAHRVLALDGINDPGNMGTLIRTALALGWDAVYFLPGSCDPFNEKVLRAARGAHFKMTFARGNAERLYQWVQRYQVVSVVADIKGEVPKQMASAERRLLVLGNESHGSSEAVRQFCQPITIPMPGEMESLNVAVAGGILLYLLGRVTHSEISRD